MIMNALNEIYSIAADCNPARITKADKDFVKKLDFRDIKFSVKISDIHIIEKKKFIYISVFGYENMEKHPIYVSKKCEEKHIDVLLLGEEGKRYCVPKILICLCVIIHYIVEENIFVVIVYKLLVQKKY